MLCEYASRAARSSKKFARYIAQDAIYGAEYGRLFYQLADLACILW